MDQNRNKVINDFLEFKENEYMAYPNLWYKIKMVLRGKFLALRAYIKETRKQKREILC